LSPPAALDARQQHDALLAELSLRVSVTHFAHAAVSGLVCAIAGSLSVGLVHGETKGPQWLVVLAAVVSGLAGTYSLVRILLGGQTRARENLKIAAMAKLRRELGLDDPAVLLPR
jgi:hypothetical protein